MIEKLSHIARDGGAGVAVVSGSYTGVEYVLGLTPSQWTVVGIVGGLVIGAAGFLVNWYYQHKRSQP